MVRVRTVAGESFEVEATLESSVQDLKARIAELKAQPADAISIVFSGRVLQSGLSLREAGLASEADTVVCVVSRGAKRTLEDKTPPITPQPQAQPQPRMPLDAAVAAVSSSAAASTSSSFSSCSSSSSAAVASSSGASGTASSAVAVADRLVRMGFDEEAVQQAVRSAAGDETAALSMLLGEPQPERLNQAFFIRYHPQFLQLREALRTGTASIREVVSRFANTTPELAAIAEEAPNEIMRILLMPDASYRDKVGSAFEMADHLSSPTPAQPPMAVDTASDLSGADYEAIDRLASMGFPREACVQAYLACDKNEEMAVNLLLGGF